MRQFDAQSPGADAQLLNLTPPGMPSRLRDNERPKVSSRREVEKGEKGDTRVKHRSSRRKSSKKDHEKTAEGASVAASADVKSRSSMPATTGTDEPVSPSGFDSKSSLPYPNFSKAHSKEAVGSREALRPSLNIFTPDPTDLDESRDKRLSRAATVGEAPPSPPLTSVDQSGRRSSTNSVRRPDEDVIVEEKKSRTDKTIKAKIRPKPSASHKDLRKSSEVASATKSPAVSRQGTPVKSKIAQEPRRSVSQSVRVESPSPPLVVETEFEPSISSNATSIAPNQPNIQRPGSRPPNPAVEDDVTSQVISQPDGGISRGQTPLEVVFEGDPSPVPEGEYHPPPPPPPPIAPIGQPKVDYLLQHGGLSHPVTKSLLMAGGGPTTSHQAASPTAQVIPSLFEPYYRLLDNFQQVVSKNGSLAVATGYRSVARRLLDRLEAVFARDISSEQCECCMCNSGVVIIEDTEGVSWGEILELVSGRRDLPAWPPFSPATHPAGLGILLDTHVPMQKMDIDVPEEYREHYIRQSRKTKQSVDKWLSRQDDNTPNPPEEVDDDTLTFAILTHLLSHQRTAYKNLLDISNSPFESARPMPSPQRGPTPQPAPTPQPRHRPESIVTAGKAIQRLYRLASLPRDPEVALYLLNNVPIHNAIATLAAVSDDEWEILVSGRFDGFLRSGAEDSIDAQLPPTRQTSLRSVDSRGPTPLHGSRPATANQASRAPTPASGAHYGAPIAYDEETEVATLAEIERDIYSGMEALEDAFEALHVKAEVVRQALRERGAGLASMQQRRRGGLGNGIEVRMGTPADGLRADGHWEAETEDGWDREWDGVSEIAPDDSASNISSSRRRRPKRRNERRTPALVPEEDEEYAESEGTASPVKR